MDTLLSVGCSNAVIAAGWALGVTIFSQVCRRPPLLHGLWLLVLIKLITPPIWPIAVDCPAWWATAEVETKGLTFSGDEDPLLADTSIADKPTDSLLSQVATAATYVPPDSLESVPSQVRNWRWPIGLFWAAGSLLWWCLASLRVRRFRQLLRCGWPASTEIQERAHQLAGRLGLARCPGVWFVPAPVSPMLWAPGAPLLLLMPAVLWEQLTRDQQDTLLVHELAHVRRRDYWVRVLEFMVLGLYWWHPAAWWTRRKLREAEEECCDAWVVWALPASSRVYAGALVETMAFLSQSRCPLPQTASGIGHVRPLRRRLTMIMRGTTPRSLSAASFLGVLALGALLLPLLPTWAQKEVRQEVHDDVNAARGAEEKQPVPEAPELPSPKSRQSATRLVEEKKTISEVGQSTEPKLVALPNRPEQIEEARDEVDLIKAQLEVKRAQLEAAERGLQYAQQRLRRLEQLHDRGAVNTEIVEQARQDVETQTSQVRIRQAELQEPGVRLRQAQRRLAALENTPASPARSGPTQSSGVDKMEHARELLKKARDLYGAGKVDEAEKLAQLLVSKVNSNSWGMFEDSPERLLRDIQSARTGFGERTKLVDLEKKLDTLLKEVESLRREVRPQRPPVGKH